MNHKLDFIVSCSFCNKILFHSNKIVSTAVISSKYYLILSQIINTLSLNDEYEFNKDLNLTDEGSVYSFILCSSCNNKIGIYYISTSVWLDSIKEMPAIKEDGIKIFQIQESTYSSLREICNLYDLKPINYETLKKNEKDSKFKKSKAKKNELQENNSNIANVNDSNEEISDLKKIGEEMKKALNNMDVGFKYLEKRAEKTEETVDILLKMLTKMIEKSKTN